MMAELFSDIGVPRLLNDWVALDVGFKRTNGGVYRREGRRSLPDLVDLRVFDAILVQVFQLHKEPSLLLFTGLVLCK